MRMHQIPNGDNFTNALVAHYKRLSDWPTTNATSEVIVEIGPTYPGGYNAHEDAVGL